MNTMVYFRSSVDNTVGLDVLSMVIGSFMSHNNTMMSSGLGNYCITDCYIFSLNVLNWSFAYLCSGVIS